MTIPHIRQFDSTLALLREGYDFLSNRHRELQTDVFKGRFMLKPVIFITGPEAAALFYDNWRFIRHPTMPMRIKKTLVGENGVQTLDDTAHRHRKAMFMALMEEESRTVFINRLHHHWLNYTEKWVKQDTICLFSEMQEILFRACCDWAGIPYADEDVRPRSYDLGLMIDAFGKVGIRHWRGRFARKRMERWMENRISTLRRESLTIQPETAFHAISLHRDLQGKELPLNVAAVELLNVLRPIVAIATYVTFIAHALHHYPEWKTRLREHPEDALVFVQEVRRLYPFTPFVGATVRESFDWKGCHFPEGRLVILDVHGIDHDTRLWDRPDEFQPERFLGRKENAFNFIPQGGGQQETGHRCAGEQITVDTMKAVALWLARLTYALPPQDMRINLTKIPTLPGSGILLAMRDNAK